MEAHPCEPAPTAGALQLFSSPRVLHPQRPEGFMANSSFETFKQGGEAIDDAAKKTGQQADSLYKQAKSTASEAYDSASQYAGDAVSRVQDSASELDEMVSEQVGRHPKAVIALGVG